jgi:hypothetical protein
LLISSSISALEFPLVSIEQPFDKDDWEHSKKLTTLELCQVVFVLLNFRFLFHDEELMVWNMYRLQGMTYWCLIRNALSGQLMSTLATLLFWRQVLKPSICVFLRNIWSWFLLHIRNIGAVQEWQVTMPHEKELWNEAYFHWLNTVTCLFGWLLVLVCSESKVLLAGGWFFIKVQPFSMVKLHDPSWVF